MAKLIIDVTSELEQRLEEEASQRGLTVPEYARSVLEGAIPSAPVSGELDEGPADLVVLARAQGAPLAVRFEDLLGDFWPDDETADEFNAAVREWRREGTNGLPVRQSALPRVGAGESSGSTRWPADPVRRCMDRSDRHALLGPAGHP